MGSPIARPSRDGHISQRTGLGAQGAAFPLLRVKCAFCRTITDYSVAGNRAVAIGSRPPGAIAASRPSAARPLSTHSPKVTVDIDALDCASMTCPGCSRKFLDNDVALWRCGSCGGLYLGRSKPVQGNLMGSCPWCSKLIVRVEGAIGKVELAGRQDALPGPSRAQLPAPVKRLPP